MSSERPDLAISFSFGDEGDAGVADDPAAPAEDGPGVPPPAPPKLALKAVPRVAREPSAAAAADVDRLLRAAGLRAAGSVDITVTTPDGIWVSLQEDHPIVVGRSDRDAHLLVNEPSVSRRHCRFVREGDSVTVEDLASANGTWVHRRADARIVLEPGRPHRLEHGDWVGSGAEVALAYVAVSERSSGGDGVGATSENAAGRTPQDGEVAP